MSAFQPLRTRQSRLAVGSVGGLLLLLMIAGGIGLVINQRVNDVAHSAVTYDVELEDHGDDLRVAVLDLRHFHRNLIFAGPTRNGLADFERAYARLQQEIDELEELGLPQDQPIQLPDLRAMTEQYYADFRPAIDQYEANHVAFTTTSDAALVQLDEIERVAQDIDKLGEERSSRALTNVERASGVAKPTLLAVLAGAALIGGVLAWLVIHTVNEVRGLYAEQQATSEQLARALQSKNDFIADASHELRTPLTVLRGNAEVGLELERDCVHAPILEDIVKESARMTRLVEDLLFLARSDSGSLPLEIKRVGAASLLAGLVESAGMLTRQYGATLETDLDGNGELEVDASRIEQAVLILVDNAVKYGASEKPVSLVSSARAGELVISVADHGPGIPEVDLPLIFERFYRVDKTRARKHGGAGLGLAIAKGIIEAHGGRIEATSRLNDGTTMTLYLPLVTAPSPESSEPLSRPAVAGGTP